jgi:transcriptional regulator with XRE-family HTH domain
VTGLAEFGERLRQLRERHGLTQEDLARAVGTNTGTVSRWERGLGNPQAAQLVQLAETLGATVDYLLRGTDPERGATPLSPAFRDFLRTDYGRIAQQKRWIELLLSVPIANPSVKIYQAIVGGLLMADDDPPPRPKK